MPTRSRAARSRGTLIVAVALPLLAAALAPPAAAAVESEEHAFAVVTLVRGLEHPWGLAFLPGGDLLVTERPGRLRLVRGGDLLLDDPVRGTPEVNNRRQGGLLDVALHPDFASNQLVYLSYAADGERGAGTEVCRGRLVEGQLLDVEVIFVQRPKTSGSLHYGSRLLFARDGTLYVTLGERYRHMDRAQDPGDHLGTVVRIAPDGSIPPDNPFADGTGGAPEVFTYGHRNVQGIDQRPGDGAIWIHEHGPKGGDEVNILRPGANYGWPAITYGVDYSGAVISEQTHAPGMKQPVIQWTPSIAPCGMAFYRGDAFPRWRDDLFVGALKHTHVRRLVLDGDQVVHQEELLRERARRIRDVNVGPDGLIYLLTDHADGELLRLEPR
jgi:glucose/arabinose dehydrogenase